MCQKVFYPQKNSSVTSCHLFLPLPEGKYPEGGWGGRTEEELVTLPEDREYFNSPSVYRGSTAKPGGS